MTFQKSLLTSVATVALFAAPAAFAIGTDAGTDVTNVISIEYDSDGETIIIPGAGSDTFRVDRKVAFVLEPFDSPTTVAVEQGAADQILTYRFVNESNTSKNFDFDLAVSNAGAPIGLSFDPTGSGAEGTYSVYLASTSAPGDLGSLYDPTGVNVVTLTEDQEVFLKVVAHIPDSASNGDLDSFTFTARPYEDPAGTTLVGETPGGTMTKAGEDTVFGDPGADGVEIAVENFEVISTMLSATKTVAVISENRGNLFDCTSGAAEAGAQGFIPGACVEYTITLTNGAGAGMPASNLTFTDTLDANLTFVSQAPGGNPDFDSVTINPVTGFVQATVNSLPAGATATFRFRATVD